MPTGLPVIDIHTHLAGLGQGGTGCRIAPGMFDSALFRLLRWKLGIYGAHREERLDAAYLERLERDVASASGNGVLQGAVIFPHERVYTESGVAVDSCLELFVPNEYVFGCAEKPANRGRFLPAMSIHPYREDALEETQRWIERGAVAMKWLPNSQGMDPRHPKCQPLFDLLAARKIPLIAHTGGEHTVSIRWPELGDPETLRPALERGVTVVMAHCGTRSGFFDGQWLPSFLRLARQYPNCFGDTSAFNTVGRSRWIGRMLREEGIQEKLIHGSDYPIPPNAWLSLPALGWSRTRALARIWSWLERDVRIKQERGFAPVVFTNAARVLGAEALRRWQIRASPENKKP